MKPTRVLLAVGFLSVGLLWGQEQASPSIVFNFRDASLDQVLQYLSRETGLTFRTEVEIEGTITAVQAAEMNTQQALEFLGSWLSERDKTLVRIGNIVKIINAADAPRSAVPVEFGADPAGMAESELYITQVIPLKHISATQTRDNFASLVSSQAGSLLADDLSNSLIITDTAANIRRLATILQALDKQVSTVTQVKVFQLANSDANALKETLEGLFENSGASSSQNEDPRAAMMRMFQRGRGRRGGGDEGGGGGATAGSGAGFNQEVTFGVDERTNSLIVTGSEDQIALVESLITDLDTVETDNESIYVYRLINSEATNVANLLNSLLDENATGATGTGTGNNDNGNNNRNTGGRGGRFAQFMAAMETETSASGLGGNFKVTADEAANSLVIKTSPRNWEKLEPILKKLDAPKAQVMIECLIAEIAITDGFEFGLEWSILDDMGIGGRMADWAVGSDYGIDSLPNGTTYQITSNNYNMLVRTLQTDGKLKVLSTPKILALDNQEASISVGQEVPFVRNSRITNEGDVLNTVQYEDIGIILTVTPHVNDLGFVRLDVSPEISLVAPAADAVEISPGVVAPIFEKTAATTQVMVMDGMTVAIGGLIRETERETISKIPLLGDIPLLGYLFTSTNTQKENVELVIFLTPRICYDEAQLEDMTEHVKGSLELLDDIIERELLKQQIGVDALRELEESGGTTIGEETSAPVEETAGGAPAEGTEIAEEDED